MRVTTVASAAALALAGSTLGAQRGRGRPSWSSSDAVLEANPNKISKMPAVMGLKTTNHEQKLQDGLFDAGRYKVQAATKCRNGRAGEYSCENIDLLGHLTHEKMGSETRAGNDIWGWTSSDGREFAIVGHTDGVAFIEVLRDGSLRYLGRLPTQTSTAIWRDMKVIGNHVYIVADAFAHGMQVFDLTKLLSVGAGGGGSSPVAYDPSKDLTAWYPGFGSAHNVVANPETQTIFVVGANKDSLETRRRRIVNFITIISIRITRIRIIGIVSISSVTIIIIIIIIITIIIIGLGLSFDFRISRALTGCAGQDGYVHDALAVVYRGADARYHGHEIVFGCNEDTLTIYDVTDRRAPVVLSKTTYDGYNGTGAYTHQAWPVDGASLTHLLLDDELDEEYRGREEEPLADGGSGGGTKKTGDTRTTTYVFDVRDLTAPRWTGQYKAPVKSVDHNQYVRDGLSYMANYGSGLRVVDVAGVVADPTGASMREVAHFDCFPDDDAEGGRAEFNGAWSSYPFFASGTVLLNCIERGVFALKLNRPLGGGGGGRAGHHAGQHLYGGGGGDLW
ncbi:regulatory P domain-containing protein [Purpureocillium lavendulum]|uniref:Regulatory P domain-containing protein n=1 Tax=Purpureocillium lavendulum TaxID=1247861 RepID=A0AB34FMV2_9HYPO|nr:regulatory P domain-containing protein [Purpureocillium lavendulum]